jgi:lipoyl synthase
VSSCASTELARPPWLRVKAASGSGVRRLTSLLQGERLNTVCSSAACPNMGECWERGTATFMILGNQCTRACRFCNVQSNMRPAPVDLDEPERLANTALAMGLKHVVITSVARDDLPDGGALQFARCLSKIRELGPTLTTEVLVPDFMGNEQSLNLVTKESPNVFNHNLETVRRLTPRVRSKALYDRSLALLKLAKTQNPQMRTKSGLMLGLGEDDDEVLQALFDLRAHNCEHLTLGQYLRPSAWHHPVQRYVNPEEFSQWGNVAKNLGFSHVESAPLVRSSYHAEEGV